MAIELLNMDCMDYLREQPDKSFDLAIVDPPYGIGMSGGKIGGDNLGESKDYRDFHGMDKEPPDINYFMELRRISKNQVIWGANHFIQNIGLGSPCWIVWDKDNSGHFADCELAYTSFDSAVRKYRYRWNGMLQGDFGKHSKQTRIHPTQKPIQLYDWLLRNYAEPCQRILDTHLGSGSSAIAAHYFGVDFVGIEIDEDYYNAACNRFNNETAQKAMF